MHVVIDLIASSSSEKQSIHVQRSQLACIWRKEPRIISTPLPIDGLSGVITGSELHHCLFSFLFVKNLVILSTIRSELTILG